MRNCCAVLYNADMFKWIHSHVIAQLKLIRKRSIDQYPKLLVENQLVAWMLIVLLVFPN